MRWSSALAVVLGGLLIGLAAGVVLFFGVPSSTPAVPMTIQDTAAPTAERSALGMAMPEAPVVGAVAPDFTLQNLEGEWVRLNDLRGRVVVVNFWATWCEPCRLEMPLFERVYQKYGPQALQVLAMNFDEPEEDVAAFRDDLGLTFQVLLDPGGEVQRLYRVLGYPTTYILDAEGVIRAMGVGALDERRLERDLEAAGLAVE